MGQCDVAMGACLKNYRTNLYLAKPLLPPSYSGFTGFSQYLGHGGQPKEFSDSLGQFGHIVQ